MNLLFRMMCLSSVRMLLLKACKLKNKVYSHSITANWDCRCHWYHRPYTSMFNMTSRFFSSYLVISIKFMSHFLWSHLLTIYLAISLANLQVQLQPVTESGRYEFVICCWTCQYCLFLWNTYFLAKIYIVFEKFRMSSALSQWDEFIHSLITVLLSLILGFQQMCAIKFSRWCLQQQDIFPAIGQSISELKMNFI